MDWKKLSDKAADVIEKRGGPQSLKEDAAELQKIATGEGTLADKAKRVMAAVKEPGKSAEGSTASEAATEGSPTTEGDH